MNYNSASNTNSNIGCRILVFRWASPEVPGECVVSIIFGRSGSSPFL